MYYVKKELEISAAHHLPLSYPSKCRNLHGHNWKITVYCKAASLNTDGMVVDFTHIKDIVGQLDHQNINDVLPMPTAENIAKWVADNVEHCYRVDVQESDGNTATYEQDEN